MKSMTGYGHGEHAADGARIAIEVRSVNRKQAEVAVSLPRELEALEARLRDTVNRVVARGRCDVRVTFEPPQHSPTTHHPSIWVPTMQSTNTFWMSDVRLTSYLAHHH